MPTSWSTAHGPLPHLPIERSQGVASGAAGAGRTSLSRDVTPWSVGEPRGRQEDRSRRTFTAASLPGSQRPLDCALWAVAAEAAGADGAVEVGRQLGVEIGEPLDRVADPLGDSLARPL